tara:strand:- start:162 stop:509 length:348 start_codon:yes stop_codon:yes gene_type:complete
MRITKRQLRRIIKEEKAKLIRESFSPDSIAEFDREINSNLEQGKLYLDMGDTSMAQMYDDDAYSLEAIRDMAIQDRAAGEPMGSNSLRNLVSRLDTAAREKIPDDFYYWIIGEDY